MSKQELKKLQKEVEKILSNENLIVDFNNQYEVLKPKLDEISRSIAERHNAANEKDYEWIKWLIVIASGVFSVIVSQVTRISSIQDNQLLLMQSNQLPLFKVAITANALGIVFGAIYLYADIRSERDLAHKLGIQYLHLLSKGTNKYQNVIPSDNFRIFSYCKRTSLLCFLVSIGAWMIFIWVM